MNQDGEHPYALLVCQCIVEVVGGNGCLFATKQAVQILGKRGASMGQAWGKPGQARGFLGQAGPTAWFLCGKLGQANVPSTPFIILNRVKDLGDSTVMGKRSGGNAF